MLQETLFSAGEAPVLRPVGEGRERVQLGDGAWVDVRAGWVGGAGPLFDQLMEAVPWRAERRTMYDRVVDVPRLLSFYGEQETLPHPALDAMRDALSEAYGLELGEPFATVGLCLYRDGDDSVAWHGDTIGRGSTQDTMVAIVSLGAARRFLVRPRGGWSGAPLRARPGGSAGDGRKLPADVGARRAQVHPGRRAPDQHAVPAPGGPVGPT